MPKQITPARINEIVSALVESDDRYLSELLIELIQGISDNKGDLVLQAGRSIALRKAWTYTQDAEEHFQKYIGENLKEFPKLTAV